MISSSKCTLYVDLSIVRENYQILRRSCPGADVGAAVKADCYGLGMKQISPILKNVGCKHFFVANLEEGVNLRDILGFGVNIYVLNGVFADETKIYLEYDLIPILNHLAQIKIWQEYALKINKLLPCALHFDTGMNRLGIPQLESDNLLPGDTRGLEVKIVMSHLAAAEEPSNISNRKQLSRFTELAKKFPLAKRSLANSSGIFLGEEYHFDLVRPGAGLYGINPKPYAEKPGANEPYANDSLIKNPVQLFAPIIQLHHLLPEESTGYNSTFTNLTKTNCIIATIPIGYADGFFRSLSNNCTVYIDDHEVPLIGRVSMDLAIIDVSSVPSKDLFLGQKVEILGRNRSPDSMAQLVGTNAYEILTRLGNRFERIYN